ncbi:MAG: hypothetical protein DRI71_00900 [Bacteroidetes bacterium]|nr:MAG: hypothetical protein DRI71_00900 [Bacteroidota bacterium]
MFSLMRIIKVLVLFLITAVLIAPASAQMNRKKIKKNNRAMSKFHGKKNTFTKQKKYGTLGFSINSMSYLGDIAPKAKWGSTKVGFTRPGLTLSYGHRVGPRITLLGGLSYGRLQSDDFEVADPTGDDSKYRYVRNTSFRNDIIELSAVTMIDLFKNEGSYLSRPTLAPYLLVGVAGFYHNPKAKIPNEYVLVANSAPVAFPNAGEWTALQPLGTEGQNADLLDTDANFGSKPYSLWQISIPIGLGIRYRLADALDLSLDFSVRILFTDYIDDVSKSYVDLDVLDSDLARAMSNRSRDALSANGDTRDISGWTTNTYTGRNGTTYEVISGFGQEGALGIPNARGGSAVNDTFYVTSIKIAYILGAKFRRAKFR